MDIGLGDEVTAVTEPELPSVSGGSNVIDGKSVTDAKVNKQGSEDLVEASKNKKKKKKTTVLEREKGLTVGFSMCVYLQKCHYNSVSIS